MKRLNYIVLSILMFVVCSCKQNDWLDWKTQNEIWIKHNEKAENIVITPTGLQYKVIYGGNPTDTRPVTGSTVVMDYKLSLIDGNVVQEQKNFTSTCVVGTEAVAGLISGMVEGLKKMHVGADFILYIPWNLAYGEDGNGTEGYSSFIPPYSALIYEVHLSRVY
ncbi:MAG: FKBP-type peptidyl-prolyl cis-trans isomerase [Paludibacteraceae bacterium]|nr:FKBP-type peptidyl-prolyl cis-trans isomerase [Paludibacteraceae bacterium]